MKIFDYSKGTKGKELGFCGRPSSLGTFLISDIERVAIATYGTDVRWTFHLTASRGEIPITPEGFGVEAICFCDGKGRDEHGEYWDWHVVGSVEWARKQRGNVRIVTRDELR